MTGALTRAVGAELLNLFGGDYETDEELFADAGAIVAVFRDWMADRSGNTGMEVLEMIDEELGDD